MRNNNNVSTCNIFHFYISTLHTHPSCTLHHFISHVLPIFFCVYMLYVYISLAFMLHIFRISCIVSCRMYMSHIDIVHLSIICVRYLRFYLIHYEEVEKRGISWSVHSLSRGGDFSGQRLRCKRRTFCFTRHIILPPSFSICPTGPSRLGVSWSICVGITCSACEGGGYIYIYICMMDT